MNSNLSRDSTEDHYCIPKRISSLDSIQSSKIVAEVKYDQKYSKVNEIRSKLLLKTSDAVNLKIKGDKLRINSEMPKDQLKKYDDYVVNVSSGLYHQSSSLANDKSVNECIKSPRNIESRAENMKKPSNNLLLPGVDKTQKLSNNSITRQQSLRSINSQCTSFNSSSCIKEENSKITLNLFDKTEAITSSFLKLNVIAFKQKQIIEGDPDESTVNEIKSLSSKWIDLLRKKATLSTHKDKVKLRKKSTNKTTNDIIPNVSINAALKLRNQPSLSISTNSMPPSKNREVSQLKKNNTQHNIKQFKCDEFLFTISEVK